MPEILEKMAIKPPRGKTDDRVLSYKVVESCPVCGHNRRISSEPPKCSRCKHQILNRETHLRRANIDNARSILVLIFNLSLLFTFKPDLSF